MQRLAFLFCLLFTFPAMANNFLVISPKGDLTTYSESEAKLIQGDQYRRSEVVIGQHHFSGIEEVFYSPNSAFSSVVAIYRQHEDADLNNVGKWMLGKSLVDSKGKTRRFSEATNAQGFIALGKNNKDAFTSEEIQKIREEIARILLSAPQEEEEKRGFLEINPSETNS